MATPPVNPRSVRILRAIPVPARSPARRGQEDLLVEYAIGGQDVHQVRLEESDPSPAAVEAAVRKDARRFIDLVGREFNL